LCSSRIGRGSGLNGNSGTDRYNARDWNLVSFDTTDYFEFIVSTNTQFFERINSKGVNRPKQHKLWLSLSNTPGVFKQTLSEYLGEATANFEDRFDGKSFNGNQLLDFCGIC
jgi:hypothetical protein